MPDPFSPQQLEAAAKVIHEHTVYPSEGAWYCRCDGWWSWMLNEHPKHVAEVALTAAAALADPVDRPDSETIEQAQQLVTYLTCPYYTQTGTKQCGSGCRDEPACMTSGPWADEVIEVLTKVADLGSADSVDVEGEGLRFNDLREANVTRCRRWHPNFLSGDDEWTSADWSNAMCGEAGETANVVKKLRRGETGTAPGPDDPPRDDLLCMLADELADTVTYADLLAAFYDIDLGAAIADKFNRVSERQGFPDRLCAPPPSSGLPSETAHWA
jgi:NTP pyrophosphatase (non-canonical NTP hydrolase)